MNQWRCLICGYIHEGENPPDLCPLCGVDSTQFERLTSKQEEVKSEQLISEKLASEKSTQTQVNEPGPDPEKAIKQALYQITYGLFIITANHDGVDNGQCANTCFQITSEPPKIAIGINKKNYTHELISASGKFAVSVLHQKGHEYARKFGYRSGREVNKFDGVEVHRGELGILLLDDVLSNLEAKVVGQLDAGTHTLFLGEIVKAEVHQKAEPMTYAYFRASK